MPTKNPSLSVRAFAEMLTLPGVNQLRVLNDQKYPKNEPQSFRIPYYQPAMKGIRAFYRSGGDPAALAAARVAAGGLTPPAKREHNLRVLQQFEGSQQAARSLTLLSNDRFSHTVNGVDIRLQFDLIGTEGAKDKYILYNLKGVKVDPEMARSTIEIAHWLMQQNGADVPVRSLEFVEISTGLSHSFNTVRQRTLRNVEANARLIQTLWPTI